MAKTLSTEDPNLLKAVTRHTRAQQLYGGLFVALGLLTQLAAGGEHPVAGMPFLLVGVACFVLAEPALLATVAILLTLSILPTMYDRASILGPEPLANALNMTTVERGALVLGKLLVAGTALNQFFLFRLLYGTAEATTDDPNLPIIPALVPNRTDRLARTARWAGIFGLATTILALLVTTQEPAAFLTRTLAEMGGSFGVVALGLGLGVAFTPTKEREAALWGAGLGTVAYLACAFVLMRFPV